MNDKEDTLLETATKIWQILRDKFTKKSVSKQTTYTRPEITPTQRSSKIRDAAGSSVSVNGVRYHGSVIGVKNGTVMVDGKVVDTSSEKVIKIDISGDVKMLAVDACDYVKVTGSAGKVETMSGDVYCGDVTGDVTTMSGTVTCGNIAGDVETMSGNIRRK